ncbi:MAG: transporter [Gemmatimonadota bacterium]
MPPSPVALVALTAVITAPLSAQTDYYNTDRGRPLTIEDAYATERYAFELQVAPFRIERSRSGVYTWEVSPEMAYGLFPRTHLEFGLPLVRTDLPGATTSLAGLHISALHNLNTETLTLPALGLAADAVLPVGGAAPESPIFALRAIATRSTSWARFHLNAGRAFADDSDGVAGEASYRWMAGLAVDRTFPLESLLIGGEIFAVRPLHDSAINWNAGVGIRYQLDPLFSVDAGIGRQLGGDDRSMFFTFGLARAFALRGLMPR